MYQCFWSSFDSPLLGSFNSSIRNVGLTIFRDNCCGNRNLACAYLSNLAEVKSLCLYGWIMLTWTNTVFLFAIFFIFPLFLFRESSQLSKGMVDFILCN